MEDPSSTGLIHQQKILELILSVKSEIHRLKKWTEATSQESEKTLVLLGSFQSLLDVFQLLESESNYFFELSNCKHLMMLDAIAYIKKLEKEIQELKS
jgi:hypothetical protein